MTRGKNVEESMIVTLENARRFFLDSKILQKKESIGHATSLAILGFEEAHKAYLLSLFHPLLDGLVSEEYRSDLRGQLRDHTWKQIHAKSFRTCLEALLDSGAISEEERIKVGFPTLVDLKESTDFAFSERLNKMKNDGFYSELRGGTIWTPSKMSEVALIAVQKLLETQIKSVEKMIKRFSETDGISRDEIESTRTNIKELLSTLRDAEASGISNIEEFEKLVAKHGELGDFVSVIARAFVSDERFKVIQQEKKKKAKR